jgi:MFS transporter, DHA1 family, multidrug resistance protein
VPLFVVIASVGLVFPNATTLALANRPEVAGSASAMLGVLQFVLGAAAAPLVGAVGTGTAVPMSAVMAALTVAALLAFRFLTRPARTAAALSAP